MTRMTSRSSRRKAATHTPTINRTLSLSDDTGAVLTTGSVVVGGGGVVVGTNEWLTSRDADVSENAILVVPST